MKKNCLPRFGAGVRIVYCLFALALAAGASAQRPDASIVVDPRAGEDLKIIAIPRLEPLGAGAAVASSDEIVNTIYRNLEISGEFGRPADGVMVDATRSRDRASDAIEFGRWRSMNVEFLILGKIAQRDELLEAEIYCHETNSERRVFALQYTGFAAARPQMLGRRIANDIIFRLTGRRGLALSQIAYVAGSGRKGWAKDVWVMFADGGDKRRLTNENSTVTTPAWGKDGLELYYTSYRRYNPDMYGISINGGAPWVVSEQPLLNISPHWSDRTERIALTLSKDGNSEIYTMDRRGGDLKRLTRHRAIDSSPCWSPSGRRICFTSDRDYGRQIFIMDHEGMGMRRLTNLGVQYNYNDGASWSPDGEWIAFSCRVGGGRFDIGIIRIDGSDFRLLTDATRYGQGREGNQDPAWSPDGRHLVYTSDRTGSEQIWIMRADGKFEYQLTEGGHALSPAWGPFEE